MELLSLDGTTYELMDPHNFAAFLNDHTPEIVTSFLGLVKADVPAASDASRTFLKDHLPDVLSATASYIRNEGTTEEQNRAAGLARDHAVERSKSEKYTARQIRREYCIVNEIIFSMLGRTCLLDHQTMRLFAEINELTTATVIETFMTQKYVHNYPIENFWI